MNIAPYHFVSSFLNRFRSYFAKINRTDAIVVLDLEDGVFDTDDISKTHLLKHKHRGHISTLVQEFFKNDFNLGIQINSIKTKEFAKDLELLKALSHNPFKTLIIPKVNSPREVMLYINVFKEHGIEYDDLIVSIQTRTGFNNLNQILRERKGSFSKIIFGHAVFNADLEEFPFFHQDSNTYWEFAKHLLYLTNKYDVMYINSPVYFVNDAELFKYTLNRLQAMSGQAGQVTLTLDQTLLCKAATVNPGYETDYLLRPIKNRSETEMKKYALQTVKYYKSNKEGIKTNNKTARVVTSHEYFKAKAILSRFDKGVFAETFETNFTIH